ncbi:MAG: hypothetical protein U1F15_01985 [Burkholderiales bacterium]
MNSMTDLYRRRQGAGLTTCVPPEPRCLTCGMLECVCRPRFFAGQVLTADDLNRLDAYVRAKNRLHNRQLHGWGVVNGLEVTCNPCGEGVAVGCGYALSPCGEDIVVCDAVTVDVCDLIKRCRDADRDKQPCPPFQSPNAVGCEAGEQEWILAIRYAETPARGVKPLYAGGSDCGCGKASCGCATKGAGCSCGGSGGGCTCGKQNCKPARPRNAPVQCEPTVICEGFAFDVYRKPPDPTPNSDNQAGNVAPDSELVKRFECCFDALVKQAPKMPGTFTLPAIQASPNDWYLWACRFREHLAHFFQSRPGYNCALLAKMNAVLIPQPVNAQAIDALAQAIAVMLVVWLDGMFACLCSALLPPCPMPTDEVRVPLAVLHVAMKPCRVLRVCNWTTHRKFATTFPALQYWLGVLPFGAALRQMLQAFCCFDLGTIFDGDKPNDNVVGDAQPFGGMAPVAAPAAAAPNAPDHAFTAREYQRATQRLNPSLKDAQPMAAASALLSGALFAREQVLAPQSLVESFLVPAGKRGKSALTDVEIANVPQFLALHQVAKPIAGPAFAPLLAGMLGPSFAAPAPVAAAAAAPRAQGADEVAALRSELHALRAVVDEQGAEVSRLKKSRKGHKG